MAEKKIQENPIPEDSEANKTKDMAKPADKPTPPAPATVPSPRLVTSLTKAAPNDLYRRLLPAVLFLLTFVTVMTMLLIYMDTVAMGAAQFRLNMSRDYELSRIEQDSPMLVAYVRQLHLAPRPARPAPLAQPAPTAAVEAMDRANGVQHNGTFVEFFARGPRDPTAVYLETVRGWRGVCVRGDTREYLTLRPPALHACLSATRHPREVTFHESEQSEPSAFNSRVLCLPLYTVLLAAEATAADLLLLSGGTVLPALHHLPFHKVHVKTIQIYYQDAAVRNKTTSFLQTKNYTVTADFEGSVLYSLAQSQV